jgi:hypothetical protein
MDIGVKTMHVKIWFKDGSTEAYENVDTVKILDKDYAVPRFTVIFNSNETKEFTDNEVKEFHSYKN